MLDSKSGRGPDPPPPKKIKTYDIHIVKLLNIGLDASPFPGGKISGSEYNWVNFQKCPKT